MEDLVYMFLSLSKRMMFAFAFIVACIKGAHAKESEVLSLDQAE